MHESGRSTVSLLLEDSIPASDMGKLVRDFPGVEEPGMFTNGRSATWEALTALPHDYYYLGSSAGVWRPSGKNVRKPNGNQGIGSPRSTNETG